MSITARAVFNRNYTINKSGLYKVNICITIDRKRQYLEIKNFPKIKITQWDAGKCIVKNSRSDATELNEILSNTLKGIQSFINQSIMKGKPNVSFREINEFHLNDGSQLSFCQFATKYTRERKDVEYETKVVYNGVIGHLESFNPEFTLGDIDMFFVENFVNYLKTEKLAGSTQKKIITRFHHLYKEACRVEGVTPNTLIFDKLNISAKAPKRVSLNIAELQQLKKFTTTGTDLYLKEVFLFICYTGVYYNDVKSLKPENVITIKGKPLLVSDRHKNDNQFVVPLWLDPLPLKLIKKYKNDEMLFPDLPYQDNFNRVIKAIATRAKVTKNVTNKVGRHTFADLMISKGIPEAFLSRMLGHKKTESTKVYYNLNNELLIDNINSFLN
jgi:integrase